ncbi:MAG: TlpA disulfide reductase family protein [Candidatus Limnocylindrales bacterium]
MPVQRFVIRVVVALVVVLVGAVVATRPMVGPGALPSTVATGTPGSDTVSGVAIGQLAPEFVLDDGTSLLAGLDGAPIRIDGFRGRPVWIVFWATWCVPCQEEAAEIEAAYQANRDSGLAVLAIDVQEPRAIVRSYVEAHGLGYTIGIDATAAVEHLLGVKGLPAHLFLDGRGIIRDRYAGQLTGELMADRLAIILPR